MTEPQHIGSTEMESAVDDLHKENVQSASYDILTSIT